MPDSKYCYPNTDVLINKLNITNQKELFEAEVQLTSIRLQELQENPLRGKYNFKHLKSIHKYIFQDLYDWAGKERTVEIGKGNLFCTTPCIQSYANSVFEKYYSQCYSPRNSRDDFVKVFADNYGDLNALHPFREGNGRAQREFARLVCLSCGYNFNLSCTTHQEMLEASKLSFDKNDSSGFIKIFSKAVTPFGEKIEQSYNLAILTSDDLSIGLYNDYDYYNYDEHENAEIYNKLYKAKIQKMGAEKIISDVRTNLEQNKTKIDNQTKDIDNEDIDYDDFER